MSVTREGLAAIALMRRQELDGFVEGLFGKDEIVDFPDRAHSGLESLAQMRALFAAVAELTADESKPASIKDMETTLRHVREMTKNAEHEMHAIVLACKRARKVCRAASIAAFGIEVTTHSSIAVVVAMRIGWPIRHPSPKNCVGSNTPTTASLPCSDVTVSLTRPF